MEKRHLSIKSIDFATPDVLRTVTEKQNPDHHGGTFIAGRAGIIPFVAIPRNLQA
ncbi:hypothetical protein SAMN04487911_14026 [Arenibacter nanhaiticus]|uniref:Uncharacterized protein n=1 Tax=Arenibacter nanhaiticus TaxID=558155 RepID=A0A1M6MDU5_9FLAO|nr:hypothetical protein [Arenibacter nanhaiticus]SHJ81617.1 hypothetical protein SAMN04487911_14026 [Arenibacter nanhaiticus]